MDGLGYLNCLLLIAFNTIIGLYCQRLDMKFKRFARSSLVLFGLVSGLISFWVLISILFTLYLVQFSLSLV